MSAFDKLKENSESKPYNGFNKLTLGFHEIHCFRLVANKFAPKDVNEKTLLVELANEVLFLPQHFAKNFTEEDIININSDSEMKFLFFGGRREHNK